MTDTVTARQNAGAARPAHPLDPVTAAEFLAGREVLAAAGLLAEPVRFAYYGLEEPAKDEVLGAGPQPPDRRALAHVRARACAETRGMAGDARRTLRLHAQAERLFRAEPHARRTAAGRSLLNPARSRKPRRWLASPV